MLKKSNTDSDRFSFSMAPNPVSELYAKNWMVIKFLFILLLMITICFFKSNGYIMKKVPNQKALIKRANNRRGGHYG